MDNPRNPRERDHSSSNPRIPRVVVITGASRGLGAGLAARMAETGVRLGLCARNRPEPPAGDTPSVCAALDVRDAEATEHFADQVGHELGPIDLWINNAGVLAPIGPLRDAPVDEFSTNIEINLLGVAWGSRAFAGIVHDRSAPGVLVNLSSGAARTPYEGWAAYCATKAGVEQLSRVLAAEEARHGLSVFAVSPGVVDTDMQTSIRASAPERFPMVDRFIGLAETGSFNTPEWVADRILDLYSASRRGTYPVWTGPDDPPVIVRIPDEPRS